MKLIIQIPCFNEEKTLANTIRDLPKEILGIDQIEYLVIDDGSDDQTVSVAKKENVHHILRLGSNRGLGQCFAKGIQFAIENGADIVVNTDGDNQYPGSDIPALIKPIMEGKADIVVGGRPIIKHPEFGLVKKFFQLVGSKVIRFLSNTDIRDATSGFRAFSKESCQRIVIYSKFSYTLETLIQAGSNGLRISSVDIGVNLKTRESRLFNSMFEYIYRSIITIIKMFIYYQPGKFFFMIGFVFEMTALFIGLRWIYLTFIILNPDLTRTYLPSLILLTICALAGFFLFFMGIIGEIIKVHRKLTEETLYQIRKNSL